MAVLVLCAGFRMTASASGGADGVPGGLPSISACRDLLRVRPPNERETMLSLMEADPRSSIRALAAAERRRLAAVSAEDARLDRLMTDQLRLHDEGFTLVAGVDEVGRGALAGPLTVAAVTLPPECRIPGLDDSKRLSPAKRTAIAAVVRDIALSIAVVHVSPEEIDLVGIGNAVRLGMGRAVAALSPPADHTLVDGNDARIGSPATAVIRGDSRCACIAAASVVAKVERDALMTSYGVAHPAYGFAVNKGYGTAEHLEAIAARGIIDLHRRSFAPCADQPLF